MAHPLANKSSDVTGSVNLPVMTPPPKIAEFIRQYGFKPQAFEAFDKANQDWFDRMNDGISRTFKALQDQ